MTTNKLYVQILYLNFSKSNTLKHFIFNIKCRLCYNKSLKNNNLLKNKLISLAKAILKIKHFFSKQKLTRQINTKYNYFLKKISFIHIKTQLGLYKHNKTQRFSYKYSFFSCQLQKYFSRM